MYQLDTSGDYVELNDRGKSRGRRGDLRHSPALHLRRPSGQRGSDRVKGAHTRADVPGSAQRGPPYWASSAEACPRITRASRRRDQLIRRKASPWQARTGGPRPHGAGAAHPAGRSAARPRSRRRSSSTTRAPGSTACTAGCRRGASSSGRCSGSPSSAPARSSPPTRSPRSPTLGRTTSRRRPRPSTSPRTTTARRARSWARSPTQKRKIVDYATLPEYVGQATAAAEDKSFYTSNAGISITGMGRALINNLKGGKTEGGSTLTQQYVERYYVGTTTTDYVGQGQGGAHGDQDRPARSPRTRSWATT